MTTERLSRTAAKIARFIIMLDAVPRLRGVLPVDAAGTVEAILRSSGAIAPKHIDMMRGPSALRLYTWAERLTGKGQVLWFGVRKRWVAESVEAAIRDGARQLLVLGAGMDPLAALVARRHSDVLCVEIDAPGTATPKAAGVKGAGLERPNHLVRAVDLSRSSLAGALAETPWRKDAKSIVVAEGLLMYLKPPAVVAFFEVVRACTGAGTRLAFTSADADEAGRPYLGALMGSLIRFMLRLAGEPLHWGLRPADAPGFLEPLGWRVVEQPDLAELRRRYLVPAGVPDEPLSQYDHLVLAETAG